MVTLIFPDGWKTALHFDYPYPFVDVRNWQDHDGFIVTIPVYGEEREPLDYNATRLYLRTENDAWIYEARRPDDIRT